MVTFLIFFLILVIAITFYIAFRNDGNKSSNKKNISENSSPTPRPRNSPHRKSIHNNNSNEISEIHPLEELKSISEHFDKYCETNKQNNVNSNSENELDELILETKSNLTKLDTEVMILATSQFKPYDPIRMMNLNDQINIITDEIIEQVNRMTQDASQVLMVSKKINALNTIEDSLRNLIDECNRLETKELNDETAKDLIEDSMGIAPTAELGQNECKKFLTFYSIYKAFRVVTPFLKLQLQEIQDLTTKILEILKEAPNGLSDEQFQILLDIQPQLLNRYRNFFNHFNDLNNGIYEGLQIFKSSTLRDFRESQTTLIEIIENIDDQLETCSYFASGSGKSENEFNGYFNKIKAVFNSKKSSKSLGIGLQESAQSFFEARAVDADNLINCSNLMKLDQIISRVVRTIERV